MNPLVPLIYTLLALLAVGTSALTLTLALYRGFNRGR